MITLKQLKYLSALAEHRHFGRAAEACAVSQPALSMQIQLLEKLLGVQVVERRTNDIVLTDVGIEVASRSEQILAAGRDLVDFAQHRSSVLTGRLTLGVIPTVAPYVLPRLLSTLHGRYPDLEIELRETQTKVLLEELARGQLDAIMLALPLNNTDFETIEIFEDPFLLAVPAHEASPRKTRISARDIEVDRLILLEEGHCLRDQALAFCSNIQRGGTLGLGATSLATVMQMVANGYGITLVPQIAVDVEVRDERVRLLRFVPPRPVRKIGLAWRPTSPRKVDFVALGQLVSETLGTGGGARR